MTVIEMGLELAARHLPSFMGDVDLLPLENTNEESNLRIHHGKETATGETMSKAKAREDNELEEFVDYVIDFYGEDGVWTDEFFSPPVTRAEVYRAIRLITECPSKYNWNGGVDSEDREQVRDIMIAIR